ncbi:hypothetical protein HanXRQr2_Chr06g0264191 [Helianthus annuus]|uniref:Uncharacterized protein n=1 Tax=Helianthus annuus TaxID=4232 RepID=A0A9K3ITZ8_HELAN|nr:hypothetical protein HanXRQr2_Chr06g0264191 [Helianthus annuus]KAJ0915865.1 hypothetical protein HanPSC8_Chr06g0254841 [Helianthus annuus]
MYRLTLDVDCAQYHCEKATFIVKELNSSRKGCETRIDRKFDSI